MQLNIRKLLEEAGLPPINVLHVLTFCCSNCVAFCCMCLPNPQLNIRKLLEEAGLPPICCSDCVVHC
jgi:hypothetical protein